MIPRILALISLLLLTSCDSRPSGDYQSQIIIQVHPSLFIKSASPPDPLAEITSPKILKAASTSCGVPPDLIKSSLQVTPLKGTDFIQITAFHDDSATAEKIVTAVVESFAASESTREQARAKGALDALDQELKNHGKVVAQRKNPFDDFLKKHGIPYSESNPSPVRLSRDLHPMTLQLLEKHKTHLNALNTQQEELQKANPNQLLETAAGITAVENPVATNYQEYQKTLQEIGKLIIDGSNSDAPPIKTLVTRSAQLKEAATTAISTLQVDLDKQISIAQKTLNSSQQETVDLSMRQHEYNSLKDEYEQARDLLRQMKIQQQEQRVLLKMPRTPITIHEAAITKRR